MIWRVCKGILIYGSPIIFVRVTCPIDIHCSNMAYNTCPINSPKSLWSLCWIQSQYCTGGVNWVLFIKEIKSYFHQLIGVHVIWGICSESLIFADESCAGRGGRVVKAMLWTPNRFQCLPFYIINEVGHLTTSVDHLAEFCQNYHLAICNQLIVKFFLQLRFIQYFDCKCMKIPDFSRIDSHFVA